MWKRTEVEIMYDNICDNVEWTRADSIVFCRTKEVWGGLSNMAGGFPLCVNGIEVLTTEALYQAMRFPNHPDIQALIIEQRSPMAAKMVGKPYRKTHNRPDWSDVRVDIMRWCLRVKLVQNEAFRKLLIDTEWRDIIEQSHRDRYWGAVAEDCDILRGGNMIGRLLMELHEDLHESGLPSVVMPLDLPDFVLYDEEIGPVAA